MLFNLLGYKLRVHFTIPRIHLEKIHICSPSVPSKDRAALGNKKSVEFHFKIVFFFSFFFQGLLVKLLYKNRLSYFEVMSYTRSTFKRHLDLAYDTRSRHI